MVILPPPRRAERTKKNPPLHTAVEKEIADLRQEVFGLKAQIEAQPAPERIDEARLAETVARMVPAGKDGEPFALEKAQELVAVAFRELPEIPSVEAVAAALVKLMSRPQDGKSVDLEQVRAMVSRAVSRAKLPTAEEIAKAVDALGDAAPDDASFLTVEDERDRLNKSEQLVEGIGIRFDRTEKGKLKIHSTGGMSGGFPVDSGTDAGGGVFYLIQNESDRQWSDEEFKRGQNIVGVRFGGATVRLPHDLSIEKIVYVKDETGSGIIVQPY